MIHDEQWHEFVIQIQILWIKNCLYFFWLPHNFFTEKNMIFVNTYVMDM
jgi:hypothetical protein